MDNIKKYLNNYENKKIILLEKINSTNDYAKELAKTGESHGTVIIARQQTAGKGRLGRSFCSPENTGLYMSIIIRPNCKAEKVSLLTSCMAVAAARAIDNICDTNLKIKWVNDLYLNGKKISGILTEASLGINGEVEFAIVGIGVNVKSVKNEFADELLEIASSIEDETGKIFSIEQIAGEIINELEKELPNFHVADFMNEYRSRSCIIGSEVSITQSGKELTALAVGIDDMAGLIVKFQDGHTETVTSGEAKIKKKAF